ncbi:acyltransferase [Sphingomonas naphthae]|uniref:Acyltransferase n=1 Tax=Sphingomonas naphthae TaxID=1813468 RepID=A0ABY7TF92_9SPHN|nr:acyltransferase [Sphingomonas naphthae]WCT71912.1 acyltransferase [Sphingomonas naphthae]
MAATTQHYRALDAMRGVAAIAVLLFHLSWFVGYTSSGALAVDFFFMLSGFVIAHAYDARLGAGGMGFGDFLLKRLIRLYPLYLVGLALAVAAQLALVAAGHLEMSVADTAESAMLEAAWLPSPFDGSLARIFPLNGPAWSLFFEIVANLLFAAFHRRLTSPVLAAIAALSGLVIARGVMRHFSINIGWSWDTIGIGFARVFFAFPLGVLLHRHRARLPRLPAIGAWPLLALLAAMLLCPEHRLTDLVFLFVACPLLVIAGAQAGTPDRPASSPQLFAGLALISYPLYVLHAPAILPLRHLLDDVGWRAAALPVALVYATAITLVAIPVGRWDERVRARITAAVRARAGLA